MRSGRVLTEADEFAKMGPPGFEPGILAWELDEDPSSPCESLAGITLTS